MKRPDRLLYIAPALRYGFNKDCDDTMEYAHDQDASEAANRQAYSLRIRESLQRRPTNTVPMRMRLDSSSSSSNPRSKLGESCKDDYSSDFEECGSVSTEATSDEEISMETNANNSDKHWNKELKRKPTKDSNAIETKYYQTNTKMPNVTSMRHEDYSEVKSHAIQLLNSESKDTRRHKGIFFDNIDSISDIEPENDYHAKERGALTSTPNSDIVDERFLDAARYDPGEESGLESTLLDQSDIREITINTNKQNCDYNFDIYQDPSSVKSQPTYCSEIFKSDYIPPPVPRSDFQLPPIHRLQSPVLTSLGLPVLRDISPQQLPQLPIGVHHPRQPIPPSRQLYSPHSPPSSNPSHNSSRMPVGHRHASYPRLQFANSRIANPPRMSSVIPLTLVPHGRFNLPRSPQDATHSLHLPLRSTNPRSLESYRQDGYIPPPVPRPQQLSGRQHIRNLNQRDNGQSRPSSSNPSVNEIIFDDKIWPYNPETKR